ncbi:lipopolysaccharide biosynthesis protein [Devosia sp. XGJD_8]|uniref:lipopolysaccharide biosynthesis protein n=1 Tax=Devosia sp. XGJD_8 TaxID=3391187 RepID=UPI003984A62E
MASLARNTYYNITAFGLNTLLSLATVPILVGAYGLAGYGLIVLARLLLPTGILGLLEGGMPEVTARAVATAKAKKDLEAGRRSISAAAITAVGIGIVAGAILAGLSEPVTRALFHSAENLIGELQIVVLLSAASLPLQLFSSVARGALEGAERFKLVRGLEVASNLAFFGIAFALSQSPSTASQAAIAYVMVWNARALVYLVILASGRIESVHFTAHAIWLGHRAFMGHALRLFSQKLLSIMVNFGPSVIIGLLSTSAMVGAFDIVMRIPKVVKTASGMFNGALLPFAARSDALDRSEALLRVVEDGTIFLATLIIAASATVMIFAPEILELWLGLTDPHLPIWLSVAMLWPISICSFGIGTTMLMSRVSASSRMSALSLVSTTAYYVSALVLFYFIGWPAFVIALVLSQVIVTPSYWKLQQGEFGIDLSLWTHFAIRSLALAAGFFVVFRLALERFEIGSLLLLAICGGLVFLMLLSLTAWLAIAPSVRQRWLPRLLARLPS